jgi:uncharacterized membrane protein
MSEQVEIKTEDGYQRGEPGTKLIALFGVGFIVILVAVILGVQFYFDQISERQVFQTQLAPVSDDFKNVRARDEGNLHSYGYIDRNNGVVRIPIERGMDLLAREAAEGKLKYPSKPTPVVTNAAPK